MNKEDSFIVIHFESPGSANYSIAFNNVTPGQIFACIPALEVKAKSVFIQSENERLEDEKEDQLSVPKPEILRPKM